MVAFILAIYRKLPSTGFIGVSRGGVRGQETPPFPGPPFSSVTSPPTQPDLTDKCNVNCFLIV